MKRLALALLLLPLAASAQVIRCNDGSYSDRCDGEAVTGANVSSYSAPRDHQRSSTPVMRQQQQQQSPSRQTTSRRRAPPPSRPLSVAERARDMGITRNDLTRAVSRSEILMGMHRKDVERILGSPSRVNQETIGGQDCQHMHWREGYIWTDYIRLCNGRVDHIRQNDT